MSPNDILALPPGPPLDAACHQFIFGGIGPLVPYSSDDREGAKLFDRMALFVGRVDGGPKFSPGRPWIAGLLAWEPTVNGYVTRLSVTAPTRLSALCKAALLVVFQPAKSNRGSVNGAPPAPTSSGQAARDLAARIGTPGARNPAAGVRAAEALAAKKQADRQKRDEKAAKKAARLSGVPYVPAQPAELLESRPIRQQVAPSAAQPGIYTGERGKRAPMPTRPKEFIAPQPIDTGGQEKAT